MKQEKFIKELELKLVQKSYKIDFSKIEEGYLYSEKSCLAESRNKARRILLGEVAYDDCILRYSDNEKVSYLTIPVIRDYEGDTYMFNGEPKSLNQIRRKLEVAERLGQLNKIMNDKAVRFCYIRKGDYYYRPNSSGYTSRINEAGIYTKEDAVSSAISCIALSIIPINIEVHNSLIESEIEDLKSRIISS